MKERKVQTNIKRHQVRQRRNRSWFLSPVIVTQLALIMVLAGIGAAFALPSNPINTTNIPWAGSATIDDSNYLSVTNYDLVYNSALTEVIGVQVTVANSHSSPITANVSVAILDDEATPNVEATGVETGQVIPALGSLVVDVTPLSPVFVILTEVNALNIIVTE